MEGLYFNVNNGYAEGLVRGYRNSLLTTANYHNLTQCETLDGTFPPPPPPVVDADAPSQT